MPVRPAPTCNFVKSAWVQCRAPKAVGWSTQSTKLSNFAQTHRADRHTISGSAREEVCRSARSKGAGHHSLETERSYLIVICLPAFGALGCK